MYSTRKEYKSLVFSLLLFFYLISSSNQITAQDTSAIKEKLCLIANSIIKDATFKFIDKQSGKGYSSPDEAPEGSILLPESPYTDWRYWNGVLNIAMINLGKVLNEPAYEMFSIKNIAFNFDHYLYFKDRYKDEGKWNYPFGQHFIMEELDDCGAMGGSVIEVYKIDPKKRYMDYINQAANHILNKQARLDDGTLVRLFPNKWTLWADDLYMSISFLCRMGELTNDSKYFDDAAKQVINFNKYLFNINAGLMYHCWYSDINKQGAAFWGRANGWTLLAQVDLLDRLPSDNKYRDTLLTLLQRQILGISRYQSGSGLWHQLLDKTDSYLETSCTAMFTYAIARAVNKGYIDTRYKSIASSGWNGLITKIRSDGKIEGICEGTGVSDNLVFYYNRPTPLNDIHGIGAVLLAGSEVMQLLEKVK